jgi:hypothetical protein
MHGTWTSTKKRYPDALRSRLAPESTSPDQHQHGLLAVDVNRILQIPLTSRREDFVAWHYNRNEIFSVRSAYHGGEWKKHLGNK